jgi:hypothetical protein
MAFVNDYQPENYAVVFDCPDGDNQIMVAGARIAQTKTSGAQMLEIAFKVQGCPGFYYERYVEGDYFNKNITKFFDALGITRGDFDFTHWKGKKGYAHFEHEVQEYINGYGEQKSVNKAVLKYLIVPVQDAAPATPTVKVPVPGMTTAAQVTQPTRTAVKQPAPAPVPAADDDGFPEDIPF